MGDTESMQHDDSLRRDHDRLSTLASSQRTGLLDPILLHSPHGIIVCDAEGRLVLHNVAAERIWAGSASAENIDQWELYRAFHADGRPFEPHDWPMARCLATRESVGPEAIRIERFDGTRGVLLASAAPIAGPDGKLQGAMAMFADITSWKEFELDTEAAHRRASFLSEAGTILLSSAFDPNETLERAAKVVTRLVADGCVIEVEGEAPVAAHANPVKSEALRALFRGSAERTGARFGTRMGTAPLLMHDVGPDFWADLTNDEDAARTLGALGIKSLLLVPMRARGVGIGALVVWTDESQRTYDGADRAMMERFAQKAALATESAHLYRAERRARARVERAAERARRMQAIAADLARALSSEQVARAVVDHGAAAVDAVTAGLWLLEPSGETARALRLVGFPPAESERFAVVPMSAAAPVVDAIRSAEPVFIESRAEYETRYPESAKRIQNIEGFDAFAVAVLPLVASDAAIGALTFTWHGEQHIDEDDRAFLRLVAGHGAQGLVRARLYEAERRARAEVALLYRLVDAASQAASLDEVYQLAFDFIDRALGAERASILLFDPDGVMRFKAWRGVSDDYRTAVEGHSPWAADARDPQTMVIADVTTEVSLAGYLPTFAAERIRSLVFIPLVHKKKLLGKLMIYSDAPRTLVPDELRVAHSIATEVAHAIARKQGEAEIVRLFAEAQAARATAEAASRMKDEFLGVVSHELRTPLSAILGWAGILKNEKESVTTRERGIGAIERNARAQLKIIEDILDVSRIISGKLVIDPKPTGLTSLVVEAIDAVRASAVAKDIALSLETTDDPHTIVCDPERVRQVVWNLLSNAIKFTPRGGSVRLSLKREPAAMTLEVRDTGQGISPEFLPHVFERFRQADSSTTRAQTGLGLGLAIVRHLVELHGGQVRADSEGVGKGATFTVTLPIRRDALNASAQHAEDAANDEPTDPLVVAELRDKRILVVDDDGDAREMLEHALRMHGADVRTAADASEAIECITQFHPEVLISDIGMPGEDGYTLVRLIRALPPPDCDLRAIAFTAYARTSDRRRALAAGYDEHVAKPLQVAELIYMVAHVSKHGRLARESLR